MFWNEIQLAFTRFVILNVHFHTEYGCVNNKNDFYQRIYCRFYNKVHVYIYSDFNWFPPTIGRNKNDITIRFNIKFTTK